MDAREGDVVGKLTQENDSLKRENEALNKVSYIAITAPGLLNGVYSRVN